MPQKSFLKQTASGNNLKKQRLASGFFACFFKNFIFYPEKISRKFFKNSF
jgi:hypothetical protein